LRRSENVRPMTPDGIRLIETGEMDYFHPECYSNFNTLALEGYFEEKNRRESFERSSFKWWKLFLMIIIVGIPFTFITQFIALKLGFVLASVYYVSYIVGTALKWKPTEVNIISSSTNLVDNTVVGFAYVFPAIALLAAYPLYAQGENDFLVNIDPITNYGFLGLVITVSFFSTLVSLFYFIVLRRLWIVEDPLPTPGFESLVKLMDLANSISQGLRDKAKNSLKKMAISGGVIFIFSFLRDFHLLKVTHPTSGMVFKVSMFDRIAMWTGYDHFYSHGMMSIPISSKKFTSPSIMISGLYFSLGWFMRARISLMLFLGSVFIWFFVVPITITTHMHFYWPITGEEFDVAFLGFFSDGNIAGSSYEGIPSSSITGAFSIARNFAIGCLIGSGVTAVLKLTPLLKTINLKRSKRVGIDPGWIRGKGWFEWPRGHIPIVVIISFISIFLLLFLVGGFHPVSSLIVALFLAFGSLILYLITIKIAGESGLGPTLGMLTIGLLILFGLLNLFNFGQVSKKDIVLLTLLGITAFGAAYVVPVTIFWDFKTAHYIGTRPMHLIKGQSIAMLVGIPFSVVIATLFSSQLLQSNPSGFLAIQAHAFATLITALAAGSLYTKLILCGIVIGVILELVFGKGTVFGLGMFLPFGMALMFLTGGLSRELWERRLDRGMTEKEKKEGRKSMKVLDSYMVMTGLFVGESMMGLVTALYFLFGGI